MELGVYTFGDVRPGESMGQRLRDLVAEMELADQVGLDVFGLGEHHRADYAVSAPTVVLAAGAARTKRIRLTTAVTVLGSEDPVRVYQQFATLDHLSNGRAEIMAGRGSFIESFPLFGFKLDDYEKSFAERLDLLLQVRAAERVTWAGDTRAGIDNLAVFPRAQQTPLPIWIAIGGTPQSVVRAGTLGLPLALAIIGGEPARFVPLFQLYREAGARAGHAAAQLKTGLNMHGFVGATDQAARDTYFPGYADVMTRIGRERGWSGVTRAQFDAASGARGNLVIGSPEQVADKIIALHQIFKNDRFLLQMALGPMAHGDVMTAIELFGTKVAPRVRAALAT